MIRTFFRVVATNPPNVIDFMSHEELGRELLDPDPLKRQMWQGTSVFATLTQARNKMRTFPHMGRFIAIIEVDDEGPFVIARTGRERGHHTIWAPADELLSRVVNVVEV